MTITEHLRALAGRATKGPWLQSYREDPTRRGLSQQVYDEHNETIATMAWHAVRLSPTVTTTDREANAVLIAAMRNHLDAFLAVAERAREMRKLQTGPCGGTAAVEKMWEAERLLDEALAALDAQETPDAHT